MHARTHAHVRAHTHTNTRSAGLPSANAASAWPVLSWQADQTKRPICSLMARAKPMRCAVPPPPSFWTPFLLPLSFRANFPLLLESRNGVAPPRLQCPGSQANANDVQRTDISYFFCGSDGGGGSIWVTFLRLLDSEQLSPSAQYTAAGSKGRAAKPKMPCQRRLEVRGTCQEEITGVRFCRGAVKLWLWSCGVLFFQLTKS